MVRVITVAKIFYIVQTVINAAHDAWPQLHGERLSRS